MKSFTLLEKWGLPISLFIFVISLSITKIIEPDTFWHIKAGELIVKNAAIPGTDPFTYTMEGEPWEDTEWLSQVVFYAVHSLGGLKALTCFKALILALTYLLLFMNFRNHPIVAFPLILCIAAASRLKFYERPQIFTYLFLSVFLIIIVRYWDAKNRNDSPARYLWALPLIMVFWANLHPGCVFGLILYGTVLLGEAAKLAIKGRKEYSPGKQMLLLRLSVFFILTFLASLLNPSTYHIYSFLFSHIGVEAQRATIISEFLPLYPLDTATAFPFALLVILLGISTAGIILNIKKTDLSLFLLLPVFGIPALLMRRFLAELFIAGTPAFISSFLALPRAIKLPNSMVSLKDRLKIPLLTLLFLLPIPIYLHIWNTDYYHFLGPGIHRQFFPEKAIEFIEKNGIQGNIFNSQSYGGALLYMTYPKRKIFWDTRHISYEKIIPRLFRAIQDPTSFEIFLSLYKVEAALVESEMGGKFIMRGLFPRDKWALVYWDDFSEVLVRRLKKYTNLIRTSEYTATNSETTLSSQEIFSHDPAVRSSVQKELERLLRANPNVCKAWYALGILYGNSKEAIANLKKALEVEPNLPEAHEALARIYHISGMFVDALSHYNEALMLKRFFGADKGELALLLNEMGILSLGMGKTRQAIRYLKRAVRLDPSNAGIRANLQSALAQKASK